MCLSFSPSRYTTEVEESWHRRPYVKGCGGLATQILAALAHRVVPNKNRGCTSPRSTSVPSIHTHKPLLIL